MIEYRAARGTSEMKDAFGFAARMFAANHAGASDYFTWLLENEPTSKPENILIAQERESRAVVGLVRMVPRVLNVDGVPIQVVGISSVSSDPEYKGQGVGVNLMKLSQKLTEERGFDAMVLFSRRAVDHYYNQFGLIGVSSHPLIEVSALGGVEDRPPNQEIRWAPYQRGEWKLLAPLARWPRVQFERSEGIWNFVDYRLLDSHFGFFGYVARDELGQVLGYAVLTGARVVELNISNGEKGLAASLRALEGVSGQVLREFELSPTHPLARELTSWSHTFKMRHCYEGGHMGWVVSPESALKKLSPALSARSRLSGINDGINDGVNVRLNGLKMRVTRESVQFGAHSGGSDIEFNFDVELDFDPIYWAPLLLGSYPIANWGVIKIKGDVTLAHCLFPFLGTGFSQLDEF